MKYRDVDVVEFYSCIPECSNYLISNTGIVRNKTTGKTVKPFITKKGYHRIEISDNDKNRRKFMIHRLVVSTFGDKNGNRNIDSHSDIDHVDRNKLNNDINNLEIVTHRENIIRIFRAKGE